MVSAAATESCWLTTMDQGLKPCCGAARIVACPRVRPRHEAGGPQRQRCDGLDRVGRRRKCDEVSPWLERCKLVHMIVTRFAPSPTGLLHLGHASPRSRRKPANASSAHRGHRLIAAARNSDAIFEDLGVARLALAGRAGVAPVGRASMPIARRSTGWRRKACSIPASAHARRSPRKSRGSKAPHGRNCGQAALSRHMPDLG